MRRLDTAYAQRQADNCRRKVRHKSRGEAKDAARVAKRVYGEKRTVYPCTLCHGFHLTSAESQGRYRQLRKRVLLAEARRDAAALDPAPSESDAASLVESEGHAGPPSRRQE